MYEVFLFVNQFTKPSTSGNNHHICFLKTNNLKEPGACTSISNDLYIYIFKYNEDENRNRKAGTWA
jgi:hypothetical protein